MFETKFAKRFVRPSVICWKLYSVHSLIDAVHFDDLVLEKDVADIDQIEAFCTYYVKHAGEAKFKYLRKACVS